jgi:hypothetical protein
MAEMIRENSEDPDLIANPNKSMHGIHIGGNFEMRLFKNLSIGTGLFYTNKGYRIKYDQQINSAYLDLTNEVLFYKKLVKERLYFLDIPLYLSYDFIVQDEFLISAEIGGFFGIGMNGNHYSQKTYDDRGTGVIDRLDIENELIEYKVSFNPENEHYEYIRYDNGLTFGVGLEYDSAFIGIYYDKGLRNIAADFGSGNVFKTDVIRLSFGYTFGK